MYAIIQSGGKQYRIQKGDFLDVEYMEGEAGHKVGFDDVLLVHDNERTYLGTPLLDQVRVSATITEQGRQEKVVVFKFKRRKMYRRKRGHRQLFTRVQIDGISLPDKKESKPVSTRKVSKKVKSSPVVVTEKPKDSMKSARKVAKKTVAKKTVAKKTVAKKTVKQVHKETKNKE